MEGDSSGEAEQDDRGQKQAATGQQPTDELDDEEGAEYYDEEDDGMM